jgi:hypothetical protein
MADVSVTLAHYWTDEKGKEHGPESKVHVDAGTAASLIRAGLAQPNQKVEQQAAKESPVVAPKANGGS